MVIKSIEVTNDTGLHARPASEFVKLASEQKCDVFVEKDGTRVTAKSILGVLSLAIGKGSTINIITDGAGEEESIEVLIDFVKNVDH